MTTCSHLKSLLIASAVLSAPLFAAEFTLNNMTDYSYLRFNKYPVQDSLLTYRLTECGGLLFFAGGTSTYNTEPWISRGTFDTTVQVADINAGTTTGSDPDEFTRVGDYVFFVATDASNGRELWKTHVTTLATTLVKNLRPGSNSSSPHSLGACNGKLLFACNADPTVEGDELWISDGSDAGTVLLKDIAVGSGNSGIGSIRSINDIAYFDASDIPGYGSQLWRSDGTADGTFMLYNKPSNSSAYPQRFTAFNGAMFCVLKDSDSGNAYALWRSDGTVNGTSMVKSPVTGSNVNGGVNAPDRLVVANGLIFFRGGSNATGYELWKSDGTATGTTLVKDIRNGSGGSDPHDIVAMGNHIYFVADDGVRGDQIWTSDGSSAGTVLLHEFYNSSSSSATNPQGLEVLGGNLIFKLDTDAYGIEWWASNGTSASPEPLVDLRPGSGNGINAETSPYSGEHLVINGGLYFSGYHPSILSELFRIGIAPGFDLHPSAQIALAGSRVTFTAQPHAGLTPTYQWQRNNGNITNAHSASFELNPVALSDAGSYRVNITTADGTATSDSAKLAVVNPIVLAPAVAQGGSLVLTVSASVPSGTTLAYQWQRGGGNVVNGPSASGGIIGGATTNKLTITKATDSEEGSYTCLVSLDTLPAVTVNATAQVVTKPAVSPNPVPAAIVTGDLTWQLASSEPVLSYSISGLPSGLSYNSSTGLISGKPKVSGSFKVKVTAKNAAGPSSVQEFTLVIAPLPAASVGSFSGLLSRVAEFNSSLGGSISLTSTKTGVITGTLKNGTESLAFKGGMVAPVSGDPIATISIPRRNKVALTLSLDFTTGTNGISGSVTDGTNTATLVGYQHTWSKLNPATTYEGRYNVTLDTSSAYNGITYPQGRGWFQIAISSTGAVTGNGRTRDEQPFTFSNQLWPQAKFAIFALLYKGQGSIVSQPTLTIDTANSLNDRVAGSFYHIKLPATSPADRLYNVGFTIASGVIAGSRWDVPQPGAMPMNWAVKTNNARLLVTQGGISLAAQANAFPQTFTLAAKGTGLFDKALNLCAAICTVNPKTGLVSGSFKLTDPISPGATRNYVRSVSYSGLMIPHLDNGYGCFTLPQLPLAGETLTTSPILVGRVDIQPQ